MSRNVSDRLAYSDGDGRSINIRDKSRVCLDDEATDHGKVGEMHREKRRAVLVTTGDPKRRWRTANEGRPCKLALTQPRCFPELATRGMMERTTGNVLNIRPQSGHTRGFRRMTTSISEVHDRRRKGTGEWAERS